MLTDNLAYWLAAWLVLFALVIRRMWTASTPGAGLVLAYLLNLWLIHWLGPALYVIPGYSYYEPHVVAEGLKQSTLGAAAFCVGSLFAGPFLMQVLKFPPPAKGVFKAHAKLPAIYIAMGVICYTVLLPLLGGVPTVTALVAGGWNLTVTGLILKCWDSWRRQKRKSLHHWLLLLISLPLLTIITQGFIGYGIFALMIVASFVFVFYRPRWKLLFAGFVLAYLGLSLYVTYMRDRDLIRASVWGGQSYSARIDRTFNTFANFEFLDLSNEDHLRRIDDRLNQSALVGTSVSYIEAGRVDYARGSTLVDAVLALIPRAIWWDKPMTAGSGDIVSQYTGMTFARGTSVGVGQIMEFYINFGTVGVIAGLLVIGVAVSFFDQAAFSRLTEYDWQGFAFWFLPGIAFLQVGGSLVEVTASAGSSLVLAVLIKRYVLPRFERKRKQFGQRFPVVRPKGLKSKLSW